jgi:hypothetical protein
MRVQHASTALPPSCKATTVRGVRDSNSTQGR